MSVWVGGGGLWETLRTHEHSHGIKMKMTWNKHRFIGTRVEDIHASTHTCAHTDIHAIATGCAMVSLQAGHVHVEDGSHIDLKSLFPFQSL